MDDAVEVGVNVSTVLVVVSVSDAVLANIELDIVVADVALAV